MLNNYLVKLEVRLYLGGEFENLGRKKKLSKERIARGCMGGLPGVPLFCRLAVPQKTVVGERSEVSLRRPAT